MNALFLDWPCFGSVDAIFTLENKMGYTLTKFFHTESECVAHHEVDEYIHFEYQTTLIHSTNDPNA